MEKIRNASYKDGTFFSKEKFLVYRILTTFTQRKRKTYANDLSALSHVSIIVYFYCFFLYINIDIQYNTIN